MGRRPVNRMRRRPIKTPPHKSVVRVISCPVLTWIGYLIEYLVTKMFPFFDLILRRV